MADVKINAQVEGPFNSENGFVKGNLGQVDPYGRIAEVITDVSPEVDKATAELLAASYNVFDGAGRALGIDACEFANRLGPKGLIELLDHVVLCSRELLANGATDRGVKLGNEAANFVNALLKE